MRLPSLNINDFRYSGLLGGAQAGIPSWAFAGSTIDLDFANGRFWGAPSGNFSIARIGSNATDLLPTSASGASFRTFGPNTFRVTPGLGVLIEESRINFLLNSTAPVTQTTQSLAVGTYTLWVNGSGSATPSAGTATITGPASATNGSPNTFNVTVAGTVNVTVSGSLNAFQLELGGAATLYAGSSLVITGATIGVRAADNINFINTAYNIVSSNAFSAIFSCMRLPATNDVILIGPNNTGGLSLEDRDVTNHDFTQGLSSVAFLALSTTTLTTGVMTQAGMTFNPGLNAVKVGSGALATSASTTPQTVASVYGLGNAINARYFNGYFGRISLFATPLSNAALGALV
jgi:hypothetical protein